jgi:hypothetical protein
MDSKDMAEIVETLGLVESSLILEAFSLHHIRQQNNILRIMA